MRPGMTTTGWMRKPADGYHAGDWLSRICGADPGRAAIEWGDWTLSYGDLTDRLDTRIRSLADAVPPGALAAIRRPKSIEFVVDLLAVLTLGAVAVPVDPELPWRRRSTLLDLTRPRVTLGAPDVLEPSGSQPPWTLPEPAAQDAAYVFFTSGSTGAPRPVLGSAAALRHFLDWQCLEFGIGPDDRVALLTALSFDVVIRDICLPLWVGGTLVIPEPEQTESSERTVGWLEDRQVSVVNVVPSVARHWLGQDAVTCRSVRTVFFAGEPLTGALVSRWHATFPSTAAQVNFYGTTETTLPKVYRRLRPAEPSGRVIPAGHPVPGSRFCLIGPDGPADAGVIRARLRWPVGHGEIVLVSRYCGHGYLGMPDETAARFIPLGDSEIAYRTGDLGHLDESGELVVSGRIDDEVKINGVRIHPAEVAAGIHAALPVRDVAVTGGPTGTGPLTAYLVELPGAGVDPADLRARLTALLPPSMIPLRVVPVAELPTLPNGKLDREALHREASGGPPRLAVEPVSDVERWLAEQWAQWFGLPSVSIDEDLFALGGDSIFAMGLVGRIRAEFGVDMTVRTIFGNGTVAALAAEIGAEIRMRQLLPADPAQLLALLDRVDPAAGPPGPQGGDATGGTWA